MVKNIWVAVALTAVLSGCGLLEFEGDGLYTPLNEGELPDGSPAPPAMDNPFATQERGIPDGATDAFEGQYVENDWQTPSTDALATFSLDIDTASYARVRGELRGGRLPSPEDVRVEEFLNWFDYKYPAPEDGAPDPFEVHFEGAVSPFGEGLHMLRVGVQAREVPESARPPANLVFLVDVSGSMGEQSKLPMLQESLMVLVDTLRPDDRVSLVTYAGVESIVLQPTLAANRDEIRRAIGALTYGGGTWGEGGIRTAYDLATQSYLEDGINRVILATDGDFNMGLTGEELIQHVESYRGRGITLTALLFGQDGIDDAFLEELTNRADGNYYHIDQHQEAVRVLRDNVMGTLMVVAQDVKLQVFLNAEVVRRYRVVGYDNRVLADEDFANDTVDAGDMGAGHTMTALLEVELAPGVDMGSADLVAEVRVRYKLPRASQSTALAWPLQVSDVTQPVASASSNLRLALAVAEFAEILRRSRHSANADFDGVLALLGQSWAQDPDLAELHGLIQDARRLWIWN